MNTFKTTGKVIVTDPCYEFGYNNVLEVLPGDWVARIEIESKDGRIKKLISYHSDYEPSGRKELEDTGFSVGVDSGQAGIFDINGYRKDDLVKDDESDFYKSYESMKKDGDGEKWYSICCDTTLGGDRWGFVKNGVVSSSGYGDGCYECYVLRNSSGFITYIEIDYIPLDGPYCDECGDEEVSFCGDVCASCEDDFMVCESCGKPVADDVDLCDECEDELEDEEED